MTPLRIGLRLFEIETALSSGVDSTSSRLRHFKHTRLLGQALRMAQLIRGMDVIEDPDRLQVIASSQLRIDPMHYDDVLRALEEADLIQRRGEKIYEKVRQIRFAENYERVGDLWQTRKPDAHEFITVGTLNELVEHPKHTAEVSALSGATAKQKEVVMGVTTTSNLIQPIDIGTGDPVLFAPMLWDLDPAKFQSALRKLKTANIGEVVKAVKAQPAGAELDRMGFTTSQQQLADRAVTVGLLPSIPVNSTNGEKTFSFVPYSGRLITSAAERELLDRARALVACVRYGERHADWKIHSPVALLRALRTKHVLGRSGEQKDQYAQLVKRGIGRIERDGRFYRFRLIDSPENLKAVDMAIELMTQGEIIRDRATVDNDQGAAFLQKGDIGTVFDGIKAASRQQKATDDELEELVETIRN